MTTRGEGQDALNARASHGLARAREAAGVRSRAEFARMVREWTAGEEPDDRTYLRWEAGDVRPPVWVFPVVAELSGLTLDEILDMPPSTRIEQLQQEAERIKRVVDATNEELLAMKDALFNAGLLIPGRRAKKAGPGQQDQPGRIRTG